MSRKTFAVALAALTGATLGLPAAAQPYVIEPAPAVVYPARRPVLVYPAPPAPVVYRPAPVVVAPAYPMARPYPYARVPYPVARPYPYVRRVAYAGPHGCVARSTRVYVPGRGYAVRRAAGCR